MLWHLVIRKFILDMSLLASLSGTQFQAAIFIYDALLHFHRQSAILPGLQLISTKEMDTNLYDSYKNIAAELC